VKAQGFIEIAGAFGARYRFHDVRDPADLPRTAGDFVFVRRDTPGPRMSVSDRATTWRWPGWSGMEPSNSTKPTALTSISTSPEACGLGRRRISSSCTPRSGLKVCWHGWIST